MRTRKLPSPGTQEWDDLVAFYRQATTSQIIEKAKEYNTTFKYLKGIMRKAGISRLEFRGRPSRGLREKKIVEGLNNRISQIKSKEEEEISPPEEVEKEEEAESMVLQISDCQIGQKTEDFNSEVFARRLDHFKKTAIKLLRMQRKAHPVDELVVFFLGDIIEAEAIGFKMSLDELEKVVWEQIWEVALPCFERFLVDLAAYFPKIRVHCVRGNHGSLGKFASVKTNFDLFFYQALKIRLERQKKVDIDIAIEHFYKIASVKNMSFLLVHGDQIPSWLSLPFYGVDRRTLRWQVSIPEKWDACAMGHFHSLNFIQPSGIPIFINGTFSTRAEYPLKRLGVGDTAQQWCYFVHPVKGVSAMYSIYLEGIK